MSFQATHPLDAGGYAREFGDGSGGTIRLEYRVDLSTPALEIYGGRPEDGAADTAEHSGLSLLATLTP